MSDRDDVMQFFSYDHLRTELRDISKPCADLAEQMHRILPANEQRALGLRKLLEAKDCFVRARVDSA